jgi:hypothetical protein
VRSYIQFNISSSYTFTSHSLQLHERAPQRQRARQITTEREIRIRETEGTGKDKEVEALTEKLKMRERVSEIGARDMDGWIDGWTNG